jgi:hypothetical protein
MPTYNIGIETTYRPVPEMLHGADALIKLSELDPRGSHWKLMGSVLLLAGALEGFGNTVGPELFDADWADPAGKQLERKGSIEKLRAIARKAGVEFDLSYEPWMTIDALVQARHTLMHPKPYTDSVNAEVTCREEDLGEEADRVAASKWNPLLNLDAATKARDAVNEGLSRLWVGLGHDARALRLHGMRITSFPMVG